MARHLGLKLQLVKDKQVIFEIPLSYENWAWGRFRDDLRIIEEELQRFSEIFEVLSNETRIRMMKRFLTEGDTSLRFADLMQDLNLNPKIVWENLGKLSRCGFLEKTGRGRYRCSEYGQRAFMLMGLAIKLLMEIMDEE